jgi:hypothetical protein
MLSWLNLSLDNSHFIVYTIYEVINMKEKLIRYWERKERYIENAPRYFDRKTFFAQAFGALEMALAILDNLEQEDELIALWNDEWKARLEDKVYEI